MFRGFWGHKALRHPEPLHMLKTCHERNILALSIFFWFLVLLSARDIAIFFFRSSIADWNFKSPDCQIKLQSQSSVSFIQIKGLLCGDWKLWITTKYISLRPWKQQSYVTCVNISDFDPNLVGLFFFSSSSFFISFETRGPKGWLSRNPPQACFFLALATTFTWSPPHRLPPGPPLALLGAQTTTLRLLTISWAQHVLASCLERDRPIPSFFFFFACVQEQLFSTTVSAHLIASGFFFLSFFFYPKRFFSRFWFNRSTSDHFRLEFWLWGCCHHLTDSLLAKIIHNVSGSKWSHKS